MPRIVTTPPRYCYVSGEALNLARKWRAQAAFVRSVPPPAPTAAVPSNRDELVRHHLEAARGFLLAHRVNQRRLRALAGASA